MNKPDELHQARQRAAARRAAGVVVDFDPARLSLARRLTAWPRTRLARAVDITPSAITQYEKGQTKPTLPVLEKLADCLEVPVEFLRAGSPVPGLSAAGAHFRSLRSTTVLQRDQALSFGELALAVFTALEHHVELPPVGLPELDVPAELDPSAIATLADQAREEMGIPAGPVPHIVRLLEAHGVAVVRLEDASKKVDAFSHQQGQRPLVLLSPAKQDKARSRFDAAHELGHLLMHHDVEPGSRLVEQQAHTFAADFLTPASQIIGDLPDKLDWVVFHQLKRRWGISLKALVVRAHTLGRINPTTYQRGMRQLSTWGYPEPGSLGPPEAPVLLPRALELVGPTDDTLAQLADDCGLPIGQVKRIWHACGGAEIRPAVTFTSIDEQA
ncbi:ImmA/IrrE family metallo-endopeptidase [Pseudonocardia sp. KRD291]|uniref:helix-turn-helix domain-containing protein n=1 Tax=Pseudonocardia sp. KRD291 TaxID=2792007 RepID=UPI001C49D8DA|nr:XRE family transcriptional regulator [Pseudonocardia sp. KRD291]MBW0106072.1 ImmA/IrrE family metallo-endopeptidase [Pseudonocardia sp. KRD291]